MQHAFVMCTIYIEFNKKNNSIDSISVWYTVIDMRIWSLRVFTSSFAHIDFFGFDLTYAIHFAWLSNYNGTIE